jgi:glycerol-3-phosphate acyltransferase PlsX
MQPVCVAVDVNGGDFGSGTIVEGVLGALRQITIPCRIYLCGDHQEIVSALKSYDAIGFLENDVIRVEHCVQNITPMDVPTRVWKTKKDSSVIRSIVLQRNGVVQASLSAGDTRVIIGASIFLLGRKKGVPRPALSAFMPTINSRPCLLLDVGANLACRAEHLISFGLMGFEYVKQTLAIDKPRVTMLNVGQESSKGTKVIRDAARVLAKKCAGYDGFIEGSNILRGEADVVVCDGFVGNVFLKTCESIHLVAEAAVKDDLFLKQALRERMAVFNSENYGAVPLLGLHGIVFKAHGASSIKAITHAVKIAVMAASRRE